MSAVNHRNNSSRNGEEYGFQLVYPYIHNGASVHLGVGVSGPILVVRVRVVGNHYNNGLHDRPFDLLQMSLCDHQGRRLPMGAGNPILQGSLASSLYTIGTDDDQESGDLAGYWAVFPDAVITETGYYMAQLNLIRLVTASEDTGDLILASWQFPIRAAQPAQYSLDNRMLYIFSLLEQQGAPVSRDAFQNTDGSVI